MLLLMLRGGTTYTSDIISDITSEMGKHGFFPVTLSGLKDTRGTKVTRWVPRPEQVKIMCWNSCIKIQFFVSVCVLVTVEKGTRGIKLLFVCRLVQVRCVKKPRRRVRCHQLFKNGCTSPRCAAWRLMQWRADSSPVLALAHYHRKKKKKTNWSTTQTHTHTHNSHHLL